VSAALRSYGSESHESRELIGAHDPCHDKEVRIAQLRTGDRFVLHLPIAGKQYAGTFLRQGPGSAEVVLDGHEEIREFATKEGREVVIKTMGGPSYWASSTPVVPTGENVDVSEFLREPYPTKKEYQPMTAETAVALPGVTPKAQAKKVSKIKLVKGGKKSKGPAKAKTPKELHDCLCGCGEQVAGRFRMGHDARYYGWLRTIATQNEKKLPDVPAAFKKAHTKAAAAAELKASGH
jgi:hypothetical protein